jgi:hypothetical protein
MQMKGEPISNSPPRQVQDWLLYLAFSASISLTYMLTSNAIDLDLSLRCIEHWLDQDGI